MTHGENPVLRLRALPARGVRAAARRVVYACRRMRDRSGSTGISDERFMSLHDARDAASDAGRALLDLRAFSFALPVTAPGPVAGYRRVAAGAARHVFDLLGSGPARSDYEAEAAGAFGAKYRMPPGVGAEGLQITRMLARLDAAAESVRSNGPELAAYRAALSGGAGGYRPVDWHLDLKSGYRWDPACWYMDISIGHTRGADVKLPWELSRSHHLVALALDAATGGPRDERAREVGLQILDWVCANPVRFGVNWRSAMDVAIRAANWTWAVSLLGGESALPRPVAWAAAKSLYEHGLHVVGHMDYEARGSTNHYLADVAGLLHVAAALPWAPESPYWTAWCLQELVSEMGRTVTPDGASYEGSTGYHRLVTETFVRASAVAVGLPAESRAAAMQAARRSTGPRIVPPLRPLAESGVDLDRAEVFPQWYAGRLAAMCEFTRSISKPGGRVPQFGDQDSGRFLKLAWPGGASGGEPRDHRHLVAAGGTLISVGAAPLTADAELMVEAAASASLTALRPSQPPGGAVRHSEGDATTCWHQGGGVCVMQRGRFWVAVRCFEQSPGAPTGHLHGDQLSFELNYAGVDIAVDPGTGVYTADPVLRNRLRQAAAHSTVVTGDEAAAGAGRRALFDFPGYSGARCMEVTASRFVGQHLRGKPSHTRLFSLQTDRLVIEDTVVPGRPHRALLALAPEVRVVKGPDANSVSLEAGGVRLLLEAGPETDAIHIVESVCSEGYGSVRPAVQLVIERSGGRGSLQIIET